MGLWKLIILANLIMFMLGTLKRVWQNAKEMKSKGMATGQIVGVSLGLLVFSALASPTIQNLGTVNITGFAILDGIIDIVALFFVLGVGVLLTLKAVGVKI